MSLLSHDCTANMKVVNLPPNVSSIKCVTTVPVKKGQTLTISKVSGEFYEGTRERQRDLEEDGVDKCACERCSDATEFGSYVSAIKCPGKGKGHPTSNCKHGNNTGYLLPVNPLLEGTVWKCNLPTCDTVFTTEQVDEIVNSLDLRLADLARRALVLNFTDIERMVLTPHDYKLMSDIEQFLQENTKWLHPSHYINISSRVMMTQGMIPLFHFATIAMEQNKSLPNHKLMLTENMQSLAKANLKIADKILPGFSEFRIRALFCLALGKWAYALESACRGDSIEKTLSEIEQACTLNKEIEEGFDWCTETSQFTVVDYLKLYKMFTTEIIDANPVFRSKRND